MVVVLVVVVHTLMCLLILNLSSNLTPTPRISTTTTTTLNNRISTTTTAKSRRMVADTLLALQVFTASISTTINIRQHLLLLCRMLLVQASLRLRRTVYRLCTLEQVSTSTALITCTVAQLLPSMQQCLPPLPILITSSSTSSSSSNTTIKQLLVPCLLAMAAA